MSDINGRLSHGIRLLLITSFCMTFCQVFGIFVQFLLAHLHTSIFLVLVLFY